MTQSREQMNHQRSGLWTRGLLRKATLLSELVKVLGDPKQTVKVQERRF
jgi:hypothetical protein